MDPQIIDIVLLPYPVMQGRRQIHRDLLRLIGQEETFAVETILRAVSITLEWQPLSELTANC